jgi:putative DNA methylase
MRSIERDFPFEQLDPLAEQESWRKEVNRPIYHIHKWWANRLGSVFRAILLGVAKEDFAWGDFHERHDLRELTVLDPFMGSGTTLGEAVKLGMRAIGCDVNPVSTFQVRQALTQVDSLQLEFAFRELERKVAPKIREFYQTVDPSTGEVCATLYYFWVKTVTTPKGEVVPLFSNYVFSRNAYAAKKPSAQILCKLCGDLIQDRFDATSVTCPGCGGSFNPQVGTTSGATVVDSEGTVHKIKDLVRASRMPPKHLHYATLALDARGEKRYLRATDHDRDLYEGAVRRLEETPLPLPTMEMRPGHNTNQARGYNYLRWRDCFNARQLLCLGMLLEEIVAIDDEAIREQLLCLFSSTLEFNNLFCSFKGEGTGAVRHMFSHHILKPERQPLENSVWGTDKSSGCFSTLFRSRLLRAKAYLDAPFELHLNGIATKRVCSAPMVGGVADDYAAFQAREGSALVLNGDSARLPIPDGSVDAVVTDPPYFDFVHYSELSDFFYSWLSLALAGRYAYFRKADSSDEGEVQDKSPKEFARNLGRVFSEAHRCLRNDGLLVFSFHHSRPEAWIAIYDALRVSGFAVVAAHPIKAEMSGGSPKSSASEPINIDAILVCRKRGSPPAVTTGDAAERTLQRIADAGRTLSANDALVVRAAYALVDAFAQNAETPVAARMLRELYAPSSQPELLIV